MGKETVKHKCQNHRRARYKENTARKLEPWQKGRDGSKAACTNQKKEKERR